MRFILLAFASLPEPRGLALVGAALVLAAIVLRRLLVRVPPALAPSSPKIGARE